MSGGPDLGRVRAAFDAVLFDMGGVLLDMGNSSGRPEGEHDQAGRAAVLELLRRTGGRCDAGTLEVALLAPWRSDYARRYAQAREAPWSPHLESLRESTGSAAADEEILGAWFDPYGGDLRPLPGARQIPALLAAAGLRLAVVSNVPLPGFLYRDVLRRHGLEVPFERLYYSYDCGSRKPAPAMLQRAMTELGACPARTVMVGDRRSSDVAAGRAAGTWTVWLDSDRRPGPEPDAIVASLIGLPGALLRLAGGAPEAGRAARRG